MNRLHLGRLTPALLALLLAWIIGLAVFLGAVIDAPKPAIYYLLGAAVLFILLFTLMLLLLVNTNTRRLEGSDPNVAEPRAVDPFALTTEELEAGVIVGGLPYGRRHGQKGGKPDDMEVVHRLIAKLESDDRKRPAPAEDPRWALDLETPDSAAPGEQL